MSAAAWPERFVVRPFFAPMNAVYPLLDLIVGRAGALTLAEITAWGLPSILVPYPFATADHQMQNARAVEAAGGAIVLPQRELESSRLEALIRELLVDEDRRRAMSLAARALGRPDAATRVAERVIELVREAA
jgi:UDP-N-acetylglucosamine--N-acetylmuramyl-(pentapeptide) pyrophosphoryl-undecaprenol N-acetylglucosamine transferase